MRLVKLNINESAVLVIDIYFNLLKKARSSTQDKLNCINKFKKNIRKLSFIRKKMQIDQEIYTNREKKIMSII